MNVFEVLAEFYICSPAPGNEPRYNKRSNGECLDINYTASLQYDPKTSCIIK